MKAFLDWALTLGLGIPSHNILENASSLFIENANIKIYKILIIFTKGIKFKFYKIKSPFGMTWKCFYFITPLWKKRFYKNLKKWFY